MAFCPRTGQNHSSEARTGHGTAADRRAAGHDRNRQSGRPERRASRSPALPRAAVGGRSRGRDAPLALSRGGDRHGSAGRHAVQRLGPGRVRRRRRPPRRLHLFRGRRARPGPCEPRPGGAGAGVPPHGRRGQRAPGDGLHARATGHRWRSGDGRGAGTGRGGNAPARADGPRCDPRRGGRRNRQGRGVLGSRAGTARPRGVRRTDRRARAGRRGPRRPPGRAARGPGIGARAAQRSHHLSPGPGLHQ